MKAKTWKYFLWICWDHQEDKDPFRFFANEEAARKFIEKEHDRLWDAKHKQFQTKRRYVRSSSKRIALTESLGFEEATLYRIRPSGESGYLDSYSTVADESGAAAGWASRKSK